MSGYPAHRRRQAGLAPIGRSPRRQMEGEKGRRDRARASSSKRNETGHGCPRLWSLRDPGARFSAKGNRVPSRYRCGLVPKTSGKNPLCLVFQFPLPLHDAGDIGVHRIDFFHRPTVEATGDHDMDEGQNFHILYGAHFAAGRCRPHADDAGLLFPQTCQTTPGLGTWGRHRAFGNWGRKDMRHI